MNKKKNNQKGDMDLQNDYPMGDKSKNDNFDISEEKSDRSDLNHDM